MDFRIIEYSPGYESRIIGLISSIQRNEYGIDITPEQQPDLQSIPSFYQRAPETSGSPWPTRRYADNADNAIA